MDTGRPRRRLRPELLRSQLLRKTRRSGIDGDLDHCKRELNELLRRGRIEYNGELHGGDLPMGVVHHQELRLREGTNRRGNLDNRNQQSRLDRRSEESRENYAGQLTGHARVTFDPSLLVLFDSRPSKHDPLDARYSRTTPSRRAGVPNRNQKTASIERATDRGEYSD